MVDTHRTLELDASNALYESSLAIALDPSATNRNHQCSEHAKGQPRRKRQRSRTRHSNTPPPKRGASGCRSSSGNGSGGGDGDGDGDEPKNEGSKRKEKPPPGQIFACPLYKQDPVKHRICGSCRLTTWARVMQHMKRKHCVKDPHCPRCRRNFKNERQKNEHIRLGECQQTDIAQSGKLLKDDYNGLKNLRRSSDEECWRVAWDKLFPHLYTPSPFLESQIDFIMRTGVSTCLEVLRRAIPGYVGLEAVAAGIMDRLIRIPTPAPRIVDTVTTSTGFLRPADSVLDSVPSHPLGQSTSLPGSSTWMMMQAPQDTLSPGTLLPGQQQTVAVPQQVSLDPPAQVHSQNFSSQAIQSGLSSFNTTPPLAPQPLQYLPRPEFGGTISEFEFPLPADMQDSLFSQGTNDSIIPGEEMFSGGLPSGHEGEDDPTYAWAEGDLYPDLEYPDPDERD